MANAARSSFEATTLERALTLWPGLDRTKLRRTRGDPAKVARLVERRTSLTIEDIVVLLLPAAATTGRGSG
ncbi:MAG: hypothetical protein ACJ761_10215 [Chloroflexota bacterium]